MWENEYRKVVVRNIIIGILLLASICGLVYAMMEVFKKVEQEDAQLSAIKVEQQQQQSVARQENVAAIQRAYETDLQTVADNMPGIVCWGDNLTAGSSGNASYPYVLQKYINTYLCDIYDFRSSVTNAEEYSWLKWDDYKVSIPVVNMGSGQENSKTVLGRAGVIPYKVDKSFEIPAEVGSVPITLATVNREPVSPLTAGDLGVNPVTINGVEGTLTLETKNRKKEYYFQRATAGESVTVEAGTEIITASASAYQDYIHIVWLGTYDKGVRAADLVQDVRLLLERQLQNPDRYLVIGPCSYSGSWEASRLSAIDDAMMQAFGNRFINLRQYLVTDGMRDAGFSVTEKDSKDISRGNVPESFRSASGSAELNGRAYELAGKLVYERMERLGFFAEIREELGIDKTTMEILKEDPNYFEKMLKAS